MTAPVAPPEAGMAERLSAFIERQMPGASAVCVEGLARIVSVGNARQPWSFEARWRDAAGEHAVDCVMLLKAPAGQLETELGPEFRIMAALAGTGVPVPRTLWLDPTGECLGRPFMVTERVPGDANVARLRAPERASEAAATAADWVEVTARLHAIDWEQQGATAFLEAPSPATAARWTIAHWEEVFLRQRLEPFPILVYAFQWLKEHAPAAERVSIVHGDYRFGNFLLDGGRVTALLDWEMVHLGDPLEDIAWAYRSIWTPEAFLPMEDFLNRYRSLSGMKVEPGHFHYYRLFNEVKHCMIALTGVRSYADERTRNLRMADRVKEVTRYTSQFLDWLPPVAGGQSR